MKRTKPTIESDKMIIRTRENSLYYLQMWKKMLKWIEKGVLLQLDGFFNLKQSHGQKKRSFLAENMVHFHKNGWEQGRGKFVKGWRRGDS